jgi:phosphoribosylpyrophosphate synthetase
MRKTLEDIGIGDNFLNKILVAQSKKQLTKKIASNENTELLQIKAKNFWSHETAHKMGKNLEQLFNK